MQRVFGQAGRVAGLTFLALGAALLPSCTTLKNGDDVPAAGVAGAGGASQTDGGAGSSGAAGAAESDASSSDGRADAPAEPNAVVELAAGETHVCAVTRTGGLRCWGRDEFGMLGHLLTETVGDDDTPAELGDATIEGKVEHVATGGFHTCVILEGGRVRCFGWGYFGQLGYDASIKVVLSAVAGDVPVGGKAIQLAAGKFHTCALLEGGTVRCWGDNANGALGYGDTRTGGTSSVRLASSADVNVGGKVVEIAARETTTCARLETGAVRCWGDGHLGYGNANVIGDDETPAWAGNVDLGGPALQITVGTFVTCAALEGRARCWGSSSDGALGYGNTASVGYDQAPAAAGDIDVGGKVVQMSAGTNHTCAVLEDGAVRCWGRNQLGQLGYGHRNNVGDDEKPSTFGNVDVGGKVIQVAAGGDFTCALLEKGTVRCWGSERDGVLGYGTNLLGPIGDDETPASAGDVPIF